MMSMKAFIALSVIASASAFNHPNPSPPPFERIRDGERKKSFLLAQQQRQIAEGVEFDTIAREWRCKWEEDDVGGKASLVSAQVALESVLDDLKAVDGVKSVERVVCGSCFEFKVITSLDAENFNAWEENEFDPEVYFLEMLADIDGISSIETQTYTKMPL